MCCCVLLDDGISPIYQCGVHIIYHLLWQGVLISVSLGLCSLFNKNGSSTGIIALYAVFLTSCFVWSVLKTSVCLHLTFRLIYGLYFPGSPTCIRTSQSITASCLSISDLQKTTCCCHKPDNWIWRAAMLTTQALPRPNSQPVSILKQKKVLVPRTIPLLLSFFVMTANTCKLFKRNNKELIFWVSLWSIFLFHNVEETAVWAVCTGIVCGGDWTTAVCSAGTLCVLFLICPFAHREKI